MNSISSAPLTASGQTKYARLEDKLKQKILSLPEGYKLAPVRNLMRDYSVSMATVTRALRNLEQNGLISPHVGRGTFTRRPQSAPPAKTIKLIGVIVPRLDDPFFGRVVKSIEKHSIEAGFNIIVRHLDNHPERIHRHFEILRKYGISGLIYAPNGAVDKTEFEIYNREFFSQVPASQLAGVILDQNIPFSPFPCVCSDHRIGGELAATHLYSLGHRSLAMIDSFSCYSTDIRWEAFSHFLEARKCHVQRFAFPGAGHNPTVIRSAVRKLRDYSPSITAIFAANDRIGLNILFECQRQGIAVPDDLSIVGFDDLEIGRMCEPSLSSIAQPLEEIGRKAVEILLNQITSKNDTPPQSIVLPVQLIERNSSSIVPE